MRHDDETRPGRESSLPPARKNLWRDAAVDLPPTWRPHRTVSVVIPAYNAAATLDLTLASLAAQDYPADLFDVVVVDDGSEPAYRLPELRPQRTRVVVPAEGWGRANACHTGAAASDGEIIVWLDSDMVVPRDHLAAHASWYDRLADVVTKGDIMFVDAWSATPEDVHRATVEGTLDDLLDAASTTRQWVEDTYARTDDLNDEGSRLFSIWTGASASVSREMYERVGGMDTVMRLGEDSELAYRLAQAGAVFVPARNAPCFHLGRTNTQIRDSQVRHYDSPHFAQRAPLIANRRTTTGRVWDVPAVRAVVTVDTETAALGRSTVDRLLTGSYEDVQVDVVGPWSTLHDRRRRVLDDPATELFLLREWLRSEPRVRLVEEAPIDAFPSPYLLEVPVTAGLGRTTLATLVRTLESRKVGVVRAPAPGGGPEHLSLWRTAAVSRARRHGLGKDLAVGVDTVWGTWWLDATEHGAVDLRASTLPEILIWPRDGSLDPKAASALRAQLKAVRAREAAQRKTIRSLEKRLRRATYDRTSVRGSARGVGRSVKDLARALLRRLRGRPVT